MCRCRYCWHSVLLLCCTVASFYFRIFFSCMYRILTKRVVRSQHMQLNELSSRARIFSCNNKKAKKESAAAAANKREKRQTLSENCTRRSSNTRTSVWRWKQNRFFLVFVFRFFVFETRFGNRNDRWLLLMKENLLPLTPKMFWRWKWKELRHRWHRIKHEQNQNFISLIDLCFVSSQFALLQAAIEFIFALRSIE